MCNLTLSSERDFILSLSVWPLVHVLDIIRVSMTKMRDCQDFRSMFKNPGRVPETSRWSGRDISLVDIDV